MRRAKFFLPVLWLCAAVSAAQDRDARADALGKELVAALGGETAWEKARQFRFDFVVAREGQPMARFSHVWDRYTGDYRLTAALPAVTLPSVTECPAEPYPYPPVDHAAGWSAGSASDLTLVDR